MRNFAPETGIGVALAVASMSVLWGGFVPLGLAALAWASAICAVTRSVRPTLSMSEVLCVVESEPLLAPVVPEHGVVAIREVF